jgi:hypothetical protein
MGGKEYSEHLRVQVTKEPNVSVKIHLELRLWKEPVA